MFKYIIVAIGILLVSLGGCQSQLATIAPAIVAPDIVSRSAWGAAEPRIHDSAEGPYDLFRNPGGWFEYDTPLAQTLKTIVIHHSALPLSDGPAEIQQLHVNFKGYADVGYHYLIDQNGIIYEGRRLNVRGAHTGGFNTGSVGIVLLGNFEESHPPDNQIESLLQLSRYLRDTYQVTHIAGHRDFQPNATVCPGEHLEILIEGFAQALNLEFGTQGYVSP